MSTARERRTAYTHLAAVDEVMRTLAAQHGQPDPYSWAGGAPPGSSNFAALVLHIIGQQISTTAAHRIFDRLRSACGGDLTAGGIAHVAPEQLRALGLSGAKAASLLDLAGRHLAHTLDVDALGDLPDADAIQALTAVRGIGPWTAQMFLIHQLHRADVLPAGDLGIRHAVHRAYARSTVPSPDEVTDVGRPWAPYRTYAAALLWASLRPPVPGPDDVSRSPARP